MPFFHQKFVVHPVGQGLFYTGHISYGFSRQALKKFQLVFDCGSLQAEPGKTSVKDYRDQNLLSGSSLDLLIISHFHKDHINYIKLLLSNKPHVRTVIAPFINFTERFCLALQAVINQVEEESDGVIELTLDPVAAIQNLSSAPVHFVFLRAGNDEYKFERSDNNDGTIDENPERNTVDLDIAFERTPENLTPEQRSALRIDDSSSNISVTTTDNPLVLSTSGRRIPVMDFLFYRKAFDNNDGAFFDKVYELFVAENFPGKKKVSTSELIEAIKKASGTKVEKLFGQALYILKMKGSNMKNLNFSALSLLHLTKEQFLNSLPPRLDNGERFYVEYLNQLNTVHRVHNELLFSDTDGFSINYRGAYFHRPDSWKVLNVWMKEETYGRIGPVIILSDSSRGDYLPNVLLTSDSVLLEQTDVSAFIKKYSFHLNNTIAFQIPHHGSKNNSDSTLLSSLPRQKLLFVNYGTQGQWGHPSPEFIRAIQITGYAARLRPVNEWSGLQFEFMLELEKTS